MRYIDLSHTVNESTPVFPGDAAPEIKKLADGEKDGFTIFQTKNNNHTGTHIDAPLHMISNGKRISDYPVDAFFGQGVLIEAYNLKAISSEVLKGKVLQAGDIVVLVTGKHREFTSDSYFNDYPEIIEDFADKLVDAKIKMLCIDFASPDKDPFPVHKKLLSNDILIVENITNVDDLKNLKQFEIIALPVKYYTEAALVRVVAKTG
jgi:kynurenine formamidase